MLLLSSCVFCFVCIILLCAIYLTPENIISEESFSIPFFTPTPRISSGVTISGYSVGGLTEKDARRIIEKSITIDPASEPFTLQLGEHRILLSPEQTKVHWDIDKAINTALSASEGDIPITISADKDYILNTIQSEFQADGDIYIPSGFWVEGIRQLNEEGQYYGQTLVLSKGKAGKAIDLELLYYQIISELFNGNFSLNVPVPDEIKEPTDLNLEEIYNTTVLKPVNPDIDRSTLEIKPGIDGYGFVIDDVQKSIDLLSPGKTLSVPFTQLQPEISPENVWFIDTLGYYRTEHNDNENRNENLRLACSKLNGLILQPDEILSYNELLGKRTREAGYKPAPAYSGTELVDEIGGGICQVSSTLYLSSLLADLKIVERKNHGFPANYIPLGLDATVNWGTTDLKIQNNYHLPIKIEANVTDTDISIRILSIDQRDYYVKMEYRVDDHPAYASAFRCKYSKDTDEQISRVLDHTSIYLEEVWCWPGYAENCIDNI